MTARPLAGGFANALLAAGLALTAASCRCAEDPPASKPAERQAQGQHKVTRYLVVDQFGYRPQDDKVAIVADPVSGWNAEESYAPGPTLEVRRWPSDEVVFSGKPVLWNDGKVDATAGDRGWWFDFSELKAPGSYVIHDPAHGARSHPFDVRADVYRKVLEAAQRAFYFNRANYAKREPYACVGDKCWTLNADYLGPGQDKEARSLQAREDAATARDLSGGWWDAGDTNRYVTFAYTAVHQLLSAYSQNPKPFRDDFGIPESSNGLPDLIDELRIELEWLKRMQPADLQGGVLLKMGNVSHDEPVPDESRLPRYYIPGACSSSTIAASSMFAHAAHVFAAIPELEAYAKELRERAQRAWAHYRSHPRSGDCDAGTLTGGDADRDKRLQDQMSVVAAIYLFAVTADDVYHAFVKEHYPLMRPFRERWWSVYDPEQGDALLFYTTLPGADAETKQAILERKRDLAKTEDVYGLRPELDLYRAYMRETSYHWGSNQTRANYGNSNYDMVQFDVLDESEQASFRQRALGILHSFHGVNPLGLVYLSNMASYGAEHGVTEIFHTWFRDGHSEWDSSKTSALGPAPGYVVGGPNRRYCKNRKPAEHRCATSELLRQPPGKAYLDFNTGWNPKLEHDKSWELTEPGIYYQAAYIKLLSKFVD